jgi:hypothetical protein
MIIPKAPTMYIRKIREWIFTIFSLGIKQCLLKIKIRIDDQNKNRITRGFCKIA